MTRYDIFFNADETEAVVIEGYADSQALLDHFEHLGDLMAKVMTTATITGEIIGEPSAELLAHLEGVPVRFFAPWLSLE